MTGVPLNVAMHRVRADAGVRVLPGRAAAALIATVALGVFHYPNPDIDAISAVPGCFP